MTLDELLRGLRACIVNGDDEDAQENIFDLLRGLRCKDTPDVELTKVGLGLKELWKREQPTVAIQDESMGTAPIDEAQAAGRAVRQGLHTPGPWETDTQDYRVLTMTLEEWLEEWAEAVADGQSSISRAEATRRWRMRQKEEEEECDD
jgi:hypothetical protein